MSGPSINTTPLRDALAWVTQEPHKTVDDEPGLWQWFWEAIQGDFNDNRSIGQVAMDTAVSMIPLVDQLCDIRDLIANCRKLSNDATDKAAWFSLALTLIGLFPTLGSLVKGVLKIFFLFARKQALKGIKSAADFTAPAMTWVVTLLRREDVQKYLKALQVDDVFSWLVKEIRAVKAKVNPGALLSAFDKGIQLLQDWVDKVKGFAPLYQRAKRTLEMVRDIRMKADGPLAEQMAPVLKTFDDIIFRLERESIAARKGIVDAHNVHFRGTLPDDAAVRLMRDAEPPPSWLSKGVKDNGEKAVDFMDKPVYKQKIAEGWPEIKNNISSFAKGGIRPDEIKGPARLYRVVSPSSRGMSDCWMTEAVYKRIDAQGDPRSFWRKYLAVWPQWNSNGQFVIYDIPAGQSLKVWRGPASVQSLTQPPNDLKGKFLEGGEEQIVFNLSEKGQKIDDFDGSIYEHPYNDTVRYYKRNPDGTTREAIEYKDYKNLPTAEQAQYQPVREEINHPNISGPFATGWMSSEYDNALPERLGLPNVPGQVTKLANPK